MRCLPSIIFPLLSRCLIIAFPFARHKNYIGSWYLWLGKYLGINVFTSNGTLWFYFIVHRQSRRKTISIGKVLREGKTLTWATSVIVHAHPPFPPSQSLCKLWQLLIWFPLKTSKGRKSQFESSKNCSKKVSNVEILLNFRPEPRLTVYRQITGAYNCLGVATRERVCVCVSHAYVWNFFADFESFLVTLEHYFVASFCLVLFCFLSFFASTLCKWFVVNFVNLIFE